MEKRNLGKTDIKLTSIGFGGAPLGNLFEELNETDCYDIVKVVLKIILISMTHHLYMDMV